MANLTGILYSTQQDQEPIEFTHFDTWQTYGSHDWDAILEETAGLIEAWEQSLGITLIYADEELKHMTHSTIWDVVMFRILNAGYGVYEGSDFIEIYDHVDIGTEG